MSMPDASPEATSAHIDLYWRPGCGFCSMLQRKLNKLGIEREEHNIWDDPSEAAIVRQYANGNETVPTVVIDGVGLVNPSSGQLLAYLSECHPDLLPDDFEAPQPGAVGRLVSRAFSS
jgi:mycoredoxin